MQTEHFVAMSHEEFNKWQSFISKHSGVWLPETRKSFLLAGLKNRMRILGYDNYQQYYDALSKIKDSAHEWASLIDLLTVHETRFYRHQESMDLIQRYVQYCFQHLDVSGSVECWSVGCATGQEAYSIAFVIEQAKQMSKLVDGKSFYYGVTGTDISFASLEVAKEGIFSGRQLESFAQTERENFFENIAEDTFRVKEDIRSRVCFVQGNIKNIAKAPKQKYDIIFCQNVLIYFQKDFRDVVLDALVDRLSEQGLLILGPGEIVNWNHQQLHRINDRNCLAYSRTKDLLDLITE